MVEDFLIFVHLVTLGARPALQSFLFDLAFLFWRGVAFVMLRLFGGRKFCAEANYLFKPLLRLPCLCLLRLELRA